MKKLVSAALAGVFLFGLGVAPASAAKAARKKGPEKAFQKLDANGDGSLTLQEMQSKGKKSASKVEKRFKKMDKDGDGKVSLAEMTAGGKKKAKKNGA